MKWLLIFLLILITAGCSAFEARQHANELALMRQDDEYCINKGVHYPEDGYIGCRYDLQNERLHYEWKCEQMLKCTSTLPSAGSRPYIQTETYRPLDFKHFHCWPDPQFGLDYIFCGIKDESTVN